MGTLIAKKYRTTMLMKLADHTYVECGTGHKAWSCWGGKAGGTAFNQGVGSTERADLIAEPNERAGIARYLIDGVCHQAANRILAPAGILVSNARGYGLSVAIFGTYGRTRPNFHLGVKGDHPDCLGGSVSFESDVKRSSLKESDIEAKLVRFAKDFYSNKFREKISSSRAIKLNIDSFVRNVTIQSLGKLSELEIKGLKAAKLQSERMLSSFDLELQSDNVGHVEFVREFTNMTEAFQNEAGNALSINKYEQIFGLSPDERIVLADPIALDECFGAGTAKKVYGDELKSM